LKLKRYFYCGALPSWKESKGEISPNLFFVVVKVAQFTHFLIIRGVRAVRLWAYNMLVKGRVILTWLFMTHIAGRAIIVLQWRNALKNQKLCHSMLPPLSIYSHVPIAAVELQLLKSYPQKTIWFYSFHYLLSNNLQQKLKGCDLRSFSNK
jgi:hypothetical protein